MATERPSLVIVDPSPVMAEALAARLGHAHFAIVGSTTDRSEAKALVSEKRPDFLLYGIDSGEALDMPLLENARAARTKTVAYGPPGGLMSAFFDAGADMYVYKSTPVEDLILALRQASLRTIFFNERRAVVHDFTERELEVLRLAADGRK